MYILFSAHGSRRVASCTQFILYYFVGAGLSAPSSLWTARDCVLVPAVAITVFRLQIDASQHFKLRARSHEPVISVVSALSASQPAAVSQPTAAIVRSCQNPCDAVQICTHLLRARSHEPVISVVSALSAPQPAAVSQPTAAIVRSCQNPCDSVQICTHLHESWDSGHCLSFHSTSRQDPSGSTTANSPPEKCAVTQVAVCLVICARWLLDSMISNTNVEVPVGQ